MNFPPIVDNTHFTIRRMSNKKRGRIMKLLIAQNGMVCHWCDGALVRGDSHRLSDNTATIDHVVPRARNGADGFENCVISCWRCNHHRGMADGFWIGLNKLKACAPNRLFGCRITCGEAI